MADNIALPQSPFLYLGTTLKDDWQTQKLTDFSVHCDDGTVLHLHKLIVCPQVATIDTALKSNFKEGKTGEYHLHEKDSDAVIQFFKIAYGESIPFPEAEDEDKEEAEEDEDDEDETAAADDDEVDEEEDDVEADEDDEEEDDENEEETMDEAASESTPPLLLMAKVYALADELQASSIMVYASSWLCSSMTRFIHSPSLYTAISFLVSNANQKDPILQSFYSTLAANLTTTASSRQHAISLFATPPFKVHLAPLITALAQQSGGILKALSTKHTWPTFLRTGAAAMTLLATDLRHTSPSPPLSLERLWSNPALNDAAESSALHGAMLELELERYDPTAGGKSLMFCGVCASVVTTRFWVDDCPECAIAIASGSGSADGSLGGSESVSRLQEVRRYFVRYQDEDGVLRTERTVLPRMKKSEQLGLRTGRKRVADDVD